MRVFFRSEGEHDSLNRKDSHLDLIMRCQIRRTLREQTESLVTDHWKH